MLKNMLMLTVAATFLVSLPGSALADHNCNAASEGDCTVKTFALPKTLDAYKKLRAKWKSDPFHGAALFIAAMLVRQLDEKEGNKMAVMAGHRKWVLGKGNWYKGFAIRRAEMTYYKGHCTRALVQGTSHMKGYAFDPKKITLKFRVQTKRATKPSSGKYKVYVYSTGASRSQPLQLMTDTKGRWKVTNFSSIKANCRRPAVPWDPKKPTKAKKYKNPDDDL